LNVAATNISTGGALINWTASPGTGVIGYYVYRADSAYGYYTRLNATMIAGTTYSELTPAIGLKYYIVRPVKLQSTPSGGYYNLGVGAIDTLTVTSSRLQVAAILPFVNLSLFPNPAQSSLNVTVNTDNACVATMHVVNAQGQVFDMITKQLNAGINLYSLNVSDMAAGVYQMVVTTGNTRVVKEWVKL
jgi:Secretion system C-terminal sorting domain